MDGRLFRRWFHWHDRHAILVAWAISLALLPSARSDIAPFTNESASRGLSYTVNSTTQGAGGAVFADLDNDGDVDLVTTNRFDRRLGLFQNNGLGFFTDRSLLTTSAGMVPPSGNIQSCCPIAIDFDNDGNLDIFVTRWGLRCLLFRNIGNFVFQEVGLSAGLTHSVSSMGSSAGDFDLDGWVDVYVSNAAGRNLLYRNKGNGTFEEVAVELGVDGGIKPTLQSVFFDYNSDGYLDLYVGNDRGVIDCPSVGNHLFKNIGGTFVDVTAQSGTVACTDSMSTAIGDFDGNGWLDIFVTSTPSGHALLLNQGNGMFIEAANAWGVASYSYGWGATFFDFDNDRHLDLYVCHSNSVNHFFSHSGEGVCANLAPLLQIADASMSFVSNAADIDNDGDLDLLVLNRAGPTRLYINHEGNKRNWVKFHVMGNALSAFPIGSTIRVSVSGNAQVQTITAGSDFMAQGDFVRHFGLHDASTADIVHVLWPGGESRSLQNYPANQTWRLYPSSRLGDPNHDGERDLLDYNLLRGCWPDHDEIPVSPGCEIFDYSSNGFIHDDDAITFLSQFASPLIDCNHNGIADLFEILRGDLADVNDNGIPDDCEPFCLFDLAPTPGDGLVNIDDILAVILSFGTSSCPACDVAPTLPGQLIGDGRVTIADLIAVIIAFGPCNP